MPTSSTETVVSATTVTTEAALYGPYAIRAYTGKRQYLTAKQTAPSLVPPSAGPDTWTFSLVPGAYKKYHIYKSSSSHRYSVINGENDTLVIKEVNSLNDATVWTIETTTFDNAYRVSLPSGGQSRVHRWFSDDGQKLTLQSLNTEPEKAAFVLEETNLLG